MKDPEKHELTLEQMAEVIKEIEQEEKPYKFKNTAIYHSFKREYNILKNQQSTNHSAESNAC